MCQCAAASTPDLSQPRHKRIASTIGIDATRPFVEKFYDVADVPGWQDFDLPEIESK
jgi:4-hydroxy-3-polyprenylbenzoate decarboxylase/2,5-furandicarboxylate decarboxylase 1